MEAAAAETDGVKAPNPQRERQRTWYASLTPEQKEARRVRQAEAQRIRRAKTKAGIYAGRNTVDPAASLEKRRKRQREWMSRKRAGLKVSGTPQERSEPVPAPVTLPVAAEKPVGAPAKPGNALKAQDIESYDDLSTHKAKALQRVWRKQVSDYLLECLTAPESPLTGAGLRASKMLFFWFNLGEKLDRIVAADKPGQTEEFLLAVLLECLRRLCGEDPTAAAPTLSGIGAKPKG